MGPSQISVGPRHSERIFFAVCGDINEQGICHVSSWSRFLLKFWKLVGFDGVLKRWLGFGSVKSEEPRPRSRPS